MGNAELRLPRPLGHTINGLISLYLWKSLVGVALSVAHGSLLYLGAGVLGGG